MTQAAFHVACTTNPYTYVPCNSDFGEGHLMTVTSDILIPTWVPCAAEICTRIQDAPPPLPEFLWGDDEGPSSAGAFPELEDACDGVDAASRTAADSSQITAKTTALPRIGVDQLILVAHIAAAFGSAQGFADCLQPGMITVLADIDGSRIEETAAQLRKGLVLPGLTAER